MPELLNRELRICEFNVENLFVSMEYHVGQPLGQMSEEEWRELALAQLQRSQKPLKKLWGLSKTILDIDPDIVMLIEVGGSDSLANFSRYFLEDRYEPHFVEGNSRRNIDLGFLVRRGFRFRVETRSNRDAPVEVSTMRGKYLSKFSRDVAELWIYEGSKPRLILLLTHLKSMLSTEQDYKGKDVRTAEAIALTAIYERLKQAHPEVPIVLGGDFNSDIRSLDLELIRRTDLTDLMDLLHIPHEERFTLIYFDDLDRPHRLTLDYLLVSPHLKNQVIPEKSGIYRYRGFYGIPDGYPQSLRDRYHLPSDHYPLVLTLALDSG